MTTASGIKNKNKKSSSNSSLSPQLIHTKEVAVEGKERKERRQQRAYDDVEEEGYLEFLNLVHPISDDGGDREEIVDY
jgi:hypothetical protein